MGVHGPTLLALVLAPAGAVVTLPVWFSDGMVLQTNEEYGARAFLAGRAAVNEWITVAIPPLGNYTVQADASGLWEVMLDPFSDFTYPTFSVTVTGDDGVPHTANNVTMGDVFLCAGGPESTP